MFDFLSNLGQPGPWQQENTGELVFTLTKAALADQFGGKIPELVDLYVTVSKPTFAPLSDSEVVSVWQIHTDSTQAKGTGSLLGSKATISYGATLKIPNVRIDPDQGGIALFDSGGTPATLRVVAVGDKPADTGGLQMQSTADKLTDAGTQAIKDNAGTAITSSVAGFVVLAIVIALLFAFQFGTFKPGKA